MSDFSRNHCPVSERIGVRIGQDLVDDFYKNMHVQPKQKRDIEKLPLSDTQISVVAKDYYQDKSFCRSEQGEIDMWKVYNLFTSATKTSYIDTFLDRNAGSFVFISELIKHLGSSTKSWYLS